MDSDIEFLEHIFDQMKEAGLVETKAEFSQMLLGKGPSYLTSMAARGRVVPMEVLDHMSLCLLDRAAKSRAAITEKEAALCRILADADREAEIRNAFEEHRRHRLAEELEDFEVAGTPPAPQTSPFIQTVLRKTGLLGWSVARTTTLNSSRIH